MLIDEQNSKIYLYLLKILLFKFLRKIKLCKKRDRLCKYDNVKLKILKN